MRKVDPVKHEAKRQEILEAAGRCFVRKGFQGAAISDICAEAKISPGHLYHYFANKEAIMAAMATARLEAAGLFLGRVMEEGTDVLATVTSGIEMSVAQVTHVGQGIILDLLAEAGRNPAMAKILEEHSLALRTLVADFLRKGQANGQIDPGLDPDVTAGVLLCVADGAKTLTIRDSRLDMEKSLDILKLMLFRFLTPPES